QSHRCGDRSAIQDGRYRAATPEVSDDHCQLARRTPQQLGRPAHRPLDGEAVEAESPDAGLALPAPGHRIKELVFGKRRVEGRIEGRDVRDAWESGLTRANPLGRQPVVERRKRLEFLDAPKNPGIDAHRRSKSGATVDDPVPHRVDVLTDPNLEFSQQAFDGSLETLAAGGVGSKRELVFGNGPPVEG